MLRTAQMRDAGRVPLRGTASADARTSPGSKLESELPSTPHHDLDLALIIDGGKPCCFLSPSTSARCALRHDDGALRGCALCRHFALCRRRMIARVSCR